MTSESMRIERQYPAGLRNRHTPRLCAGCRGPLTAARRCTRCESTTSAERALLHFPDRRTRLERMERAARR